VYSHRSNWLHVTQALSPQGMGFSGSDSMLTIVPMFYARVGPAVRRIDGGGPC
jgi:fatty-acyl-CoA synthase